MNTQTLPSPQDNRTRAKHLYWQGWRIVRISEVLEENPATVYSWKERDKWDESTPIQRVEAALESRLLQLIVKDEKEGKDFKEIDLLGRQIERVARVNKYGETGKESDLNPKIKNRNDAKRKLKNDIGEDGPELLLAEFKNSLFDYQKTWYEAGQKYRIRDLLKSRQIGATWYFAREAICDASLTGKNKIFLSASRAQAYVFKNYIIQFVREVTGVELKGDPIILDNGAELHFLGTNARTAQSYHGDIYMDEYFWIHGFQEFRKVASGMAMHKQWNQTYISTPSSINHEAYPYWSGELFNKRRKKSEKVKIDITHSALKDGLLCADNQWRQIVTVHDAVAGGCDLFDIDQLRMEYSEDEFKNLLECEFVDDTLSVFPMSSMQSCMVDSWLVWRDYRPSASRPLGDSGVWVSLDPDGGGEDGDGAGLTVVSPATGSKPFRVIEKKRMRGLDYEQQAEEVRKLTLKYKVDKIDVDGTGLGVSTAKVIATFFPAVRVHNFTVESKAMLIYKTQSVIKNGRLQFDAGDIDLAQSFMSIRRQLTKSTQQLTYTAGRREGTGHADLAWALMMSISNEPMEASARGNTGNGITEIY